MGPGTLAVPTDVSVKAQVDSLAAQVVAAHGKIDVWANVAGILQFGPIVETTEEDLDRIIGINLKGVYWGSAAAATSDGSSTAGVDHQHRIGGRGGARPGHIRLCAHQGRRADVHAHLGRRGRAVGSSGQLGGAGLRRDPDDRSALHERGRHRRSGSAPRHSGRPRTTHRHPCGSPENPRTSPTPCCTWPPMPRAS